MKYSVITINYNNRDGLARTIESVVGQTCRDYEYLIIDGGSTDGSVDVIKAHEASIDYWISEQDHGVYHAMNKGVAQAHGDYCIFMNSGDCFHSAGALAEASIYDADIVCGKVLKGSNPQPQGHRKADITLVDLMRGSLPHQAMIIKRELLVRHPYDEHYKILSAWKFCLQTLVFDNCSYRNIDTIIAD
jgi:glycosyltransferase involved in cell wall biosynthesis